MKNFFAVLVVIMLSTAAHAQDISWTKGFATPLVENLLDCGSRARKSAVGEITSEDGKVWTVPAATRFESARRAEDLYNDCGGEQLESIRQLDVAGLPILDAGGDEVFTTYLFADNYFELYVNGVLLAVDPVPFTPFNSNVVRFRAKRPVTVALKLVDWEESLGLGVEKGRGSRFSPGDGGVVVVVKDDTGSTVLLTDDKWRAQTFYVAPLVDRSCLSVAGTNRDSSACNGQQVTAPAETSAAHWPVPKAWVSAGFDDSQWPMAVTYSNETVGVRNKQAFTRFTDIFDAADGDAQFIWSSNLVLDNLVLLRATFD